MLPLGCICVFASLLTAVVHACVIVGGNADRRHITQDEFESQRVLGNAQPCTTRSDRKREVVLETTTAPNVRLEYVTKDNGTPHPSQQVLPE